MRNNFSQISLFDIYSDISDAIAECEYLQGQRGQEQRKESSKQFAMYLHMESLLSRILSYSI